MTKQIYPFLVVDKEHVGSFFDGDLPQVGGAVELFRMTDDDLLGIRIGIRPSKRKPNIFLCFYGCLKKIRNIGF